MSIGKLLCVPEATVAVEVTVMEREYCHAAWAELWNAKKRRRIVPETSKGLLSFFIYLSLILHSPQRLKSSPYAHVWEDLHVS
jgi:hypothetical protein